MIRVNLLKRNPWIQVAAFAGIGAVIVLSAVGWSEKDHPLTSRLPSSEEASTERNGSHRRWLLTGAEADVSAFVSVNSLRTKRLFSRGEIALLKRLGRDRLASVRTLELSSAEEAIRLQKKIRVSRARVYLQPDFTVRAERRHGPRKSSERTDPSARDPFFAEQWALKNTGKTHREFIDDFRSKYITGVTGEDVHLPENSKEGQGIVVAVLDSGVDLRHPDLENQIHVKPAECAALTKYLECLEKEDRATCDKTLGKTDTDGNGYPMDCYGWNMLGEENPETGVIGNHEMEDPADIAHGTHVAGIIAAEAGNGVGIRGIAPRAKILPVRVVDTEVGKGEGTVAQEADATSLISVVIRGMLYAVASKANVINLSLGWDRIADSFIVNEETGRPLMQEAVDLARSQGILVVSSAGNDSTDALVYPCQYTGVLCAGALAPDGKIASHSNYGSGVDIAAPGQDILSTMPLDYVPEVFTDQNGYDFLDGTSMAAPHVSGAAAILMSEGYSAEETYARLVSGARRQPLAQSKLVLSGSLDVQGALQARPKPLFAPVVKGASYALWDSTQDRVRLRLKIKNLWASGSGVSVSLSSMDASGEAGFYRLERTRYDFGAWISGEEKILETEMRILDRRVTSEILIRAEIRYGSQVQVIRLPVILSVGITKEGGHPESRFIPVASGEKIPGSDLFTILSLDGKSEADYVAFAKGSKEWRLQIVRETPEGYVFGPAKVLPALKRGEIRTRQRLDLNGDGKSDYVIAFTHDGEKDPNAKGSRFPTWFTFLYLNESGQEIYPASLFKNQVTEVDLERFQWLQVSGRKVQAWVRSGSTPEAEKPVGYDPWNPKPKDERRMRFFYHDPATKDGLRSLLPPSKRYFVGVLQQSLEQRQAGQVSVVLTDSFNYTTNFSLATIDANTKLSEAVPIRMGSYRNIRGLEAQTPTVLSGTSDPVMAFVGGTGVADQGMSILLNRGSFVETLDQSIAPQDETDFAHKVMGIFLDEKPNGSSSVASFAQANYSFLYRDSTLDRPLETSLRRYTFLPSSMFLRLFYSAVAESGGERLPALFIGDGFGAYLGAEIIAPVRDPSGKTVGLTRPAFLRFINRDQDCEWLDPLKATPESPSQAVYFCGDRFLRIPYRF